MSEWQSYYTKHKRNHHGDRLAMEARTALREIVEREHAAGFFLGEIKNTISSALYCEIERIRKSPASIDSHRSGK